MLAYVMQHGKPVHHRQRDSIDCLNLLVTVLQVAKRIEEPITALNSLGRWVYPSLEEIEECVMPTGKTRNYIYTYGPRLFNVDSKNQVDDFLIPLLKNRPETGRAVLLTWDTRHDSQASGREMPGIVAFDFKLREGALNATAFIRSNDMFFGWPANIYQTYVLQKYVAGKLGARLGAISTFSTSAHVYDDTLPHIKKILGKRMKSGDAAG